MPASRKVTRFGLGQRRPHDTEQAHPYLLVMQEPQSTLPSEIRSAAEQVDRLSKRIWRVKTPVDPQGVQGVSIAENAGVWDLFDPSTDRIFVVLETLAHQVPERAGRILERYGAKDLYLTMRQGRELIPLTSPATLSEVRNNLSQFAAIKDVRRLTAGQVAHALFFDRIPPRESIRPAQSAATGGTGILGAAVLLLGGIGVVSQLGGSQKGGISATPSETE